MMSPLNIQKHVTSPQLSGAWRAAFSSFVGALVLPIFFISSTAHPVKADSSSPHMAHDKSVNRPPVPATKDVSGAMRTIRTIVRNNHSLVTHRRLGVADAYIMAGNINAQIKSIRESSPNQELMRALQPILQDIKTGVGAIANPSEKLSRLDGLFQIDSALEAYGRVVSDPEWESLRAQ